MNEFICAKCGRACYSAASIEDMRDDRCPWPGCGGRIAKADGEASIPAGCSGCAHDLGGGCCRINLEAECAAGDFEMYEAESSMNGKEKEDG